MSDDEELERIKKKKMEEMMKLSKNVVQIPDHVLQINGVDELNKVITDYKDGIVIVDFWAEWCGPCIAFAPHFEALQKEYFQRGENVIFCKCNVDLNPAIAGQFQISAIPTTVFIHNKTLVYRNLGLVPKGQFKQIIEAIKKKLNL
ncbi:MAG: thioredoxin family protein [Promethearchaeota archaeon]